jgi:hypothetical protein
MFFDSLVLTINQTVKSLLYFNRNKIFFLFSAYCILKDSLLMEEFQNHMHQLDIIAQQLENVNIKQFVNEIEQIGLLIIYS